MQSEVIINNEFINLYTEENPMLNSGDECYFLLFNNKDFHLPIIAKGIIIEDLFIDGFNKQYKIRLLEFVDSPKIVNKFVIKNSFVVYPVLANGKIQARKTVQLSLNFNFERHLFKLEAFFVRKELDDIIKLRDKYGNFILNDLKKMVTELENLIS